MDELFEGGLPSNGIITLELDSHVNTQVVMAFLNKIIAGFMHRGNPVVFEPFEGVEQEHIDHLLKSYPSLKSKSVIEVMSNGNKTKILDYLSRPKYDETKKRLQQFQSTVRRLKIKYKKEPLSIIGSNMANGFSDVKGERQGIENLVSFIKSNSAFSVFVLRQSNNCLLDYLSEISDIHLKILEINGSLFLQSEIPWSNLYAIIAKNNDNHNEVVIEPIV